jgi:sugar lactone lactonase YvrE
MLLQRREFLAALLVSPLPGTLEAPAHAARVTQLFKSPEGHPNALETSSDGLWIGEQTTDRAHLVDWHGKLLRSVQTESSNTSGIAFGNGYLWMAANGPAIGRAPKPTDVTTGEVIKVDPATGKTLGRNPIPGGGGVHGLEFVGGTLWITSLQIRKLSQVNPETFEVIHQIPVHLDRAHGLAWDRGAIWCMHSSDRVIHKLDATNGRLLEQITLTPRDPDPHGMCLYNGHLYYCDAGIGPGGVDTKSPAAGFICRIDLT